VEAEEEDTPEAAEEDTPAVPEAAEDTVKNIVEVRAIVNLSVKTDASGKCF